MQQCMQDLQLVYRQDGDSGVTRIAVTPSPEVILSKMNKWKDVHSSSTMHVFTSETIPAIDRLKHHTSSGCISNIPPGGVTNRKECFHHKPFGDSTCLCTFNSHNVLAQFFKKDTQTGGFMTDYC